MTKLTEKKCKPCEGGTPPLPTDETEKLLAELNGGQIWANIPWEIVKDGKAITKEFRFKNFREAQAFVNNVADVAEGEAHHPDIHWYYNRIQFELSTHAVGGLSENDFILAAKIEQVLNVQGE